MHLIWENVVKNLMHLWAGTYKDLDQGSEEYQMHGPIWEEVGKASADSGSTIPFVFGPRPPNVASDKISWTADTRSFWFQYIAPVLLRGRFLHDKYYDHFIELVHLIMVCLQFEITEAEIDELRQGFIHWVKTYEDIYYQHDPSRLSACPLTIHALLHIADSILETGPVWTAWAFPMERYCGALQPAIRSRRFPYSSLNRYVLDRARLTHLKVIYGLYDTLSLQPSHKDTSTSIPGYDTFVLMPQRSPLTLNRTLMDKILSCLTLRFTATPNEVRAALPRTVEQWAKLRILPEGDTIRAADLQNPGEDTRDATYVRNARYRNRPAIMEPRTFYGQLLHILVIDVKPIPTAVPPKTTDTKLVLGVIRTCVTDGDHNVLDIHYYKNHGRVEVVEITTIQCVVGRVKDRGRFAIIDRSGALARPEFVHD
ncbi:hypothetical protein L226DRAFT_547468 [Lentinus tigrinus ALCF2SS1-7]|uniref:uncharacterized protein n=1 Tax=Lentinus tigrinus ALCF2SS1-7 TaxID=1328758 RepID=UPI00116635FF|nr:hypothetical protein L226DRAFT_547468 [Lentinus tigrinus ALCF2SS1-7]